MSLYKIEWCEKKTSAKGTEYYRVTVTDAENKTTNDVAVFSSFTDYANIQAGRDVTGRLTSKEYNGKQSYTLENELPQPGAFKRPPGAITQAMDKKNQMIQTAQSNKEQGIMTSSTIRMAVDIALAELPQGSVNGNVHQVFFDAGVFKGRVKFWRDWLIAEWDNVTSAPPFNG